MVDSVEAQAPRNILYALRRILLAIRRNPNCTRHTMQGVIQLLRRIYLLIVSTEQLVFVTPPPGEFDRLVCRLERWVVQWEQRATIDIEINDLIPIFYQTLHWSQEQDVHNNAELVNKYMRNGRLIYDVSPTVPQILREAVQQ